MKQLNQKLGSSLLISAFYLIDSGELYTWGQNNQGQLGIGHRNNELAPHLVTFFANNPIVKVAAGEYHTLALTGMFPIHRLQPDLIIDRRAR